MASGGTNAGFFQTRFLQMSGGLQMCLNLRARRAAIGIVAGSGHCAATRPSRHATNLSFALPERTGAWPKRQQHHGEKRQMGKRAGQKPREMQRHEWKVYQKTQRALFFCCEILFLKKGKLIEKLTPSCEPTKKG